jgi:hypothetical protein
MGRAIHYWRKTLLGRHPATARVLVSCRILDLSTYLTREMVQAR